MRHDSGILGSEAQARGCGSVDCRYLVEEIGKPHKLAVVGQIKAEHRIRIGMILNIAIKHRLLLKKPQGKSLERELRMTCSYPAVANVIDTPSDYFNIDDWGKDMEAKLLKQ